LQLAAIARHVERITYNPGSVIIEENAIGDAAVLIVSGTAARVSGPELTARSEPVVAGSLLGEAAMLIETTYGSTVVARSAVRALHITRDRLEAQILLDRSLGERLVHNLARRLTEFAAELRRVEVSLAGSKTRSRDKTTAPDQKALAAPAH